MKYVRALADGAWLEVPIPIVRPIDTEVDPHAPPPPKLVRTLVKACEQGLWSVNADGVPVSPGLVVGFREAQDAAWFLNQPHRADRVVVSAGEIVTFHEEADAQHFIEQGLAERVNRQEAKALLAEWATHAKATNVLNITTPAQAGKHAAR
jgi:hypothetical protein